jgi:hypothetical protein
LTLLNSFQTGEVSFLFVHRSSYSSPSTSITSFSLSSSISIGWESFEDSAGDPKSGIDTDSVCEDLLLVVLMLLPLVADISPNLQVIIQ